MKPESPRADLEAAPAGWRRPAVAVLVVAGAALLAYHNSFRVPFVLDDDLAIGANPSLRSLATAWWPPDNLTGLPISGRPVVNFSLGLNYAISGSGVWSYHVVNLLIHLACGALLFGVVRRTFLLPALAARFGRRAFELALLTALLWTLHPLQTESVTYISQRAESLVGFFYLLTLYCFVRAAGNVGKNSAPFTTRAPRHKDDLDRARASFVPPCRCDSNRKETFWSVLTVFSCVAGMATKEVMASAPLFVLLYDRALAAGSFRAAWRERRGLYAGLAASWLLLLFVVVHEHGARGASAGFGLGVSAWSYLLTQCEAIVLYLKLSFWPHPLVLDYGTALARSVADVWWQGGVVLALFGGTVWALVRRPAAGCLGAWFFLILAPSSSIIPLVGQTIAEHRMYLPLAAVVASGVAALDALRCRPALRLALAASLVLPLGWLTASRNRDYATDISIGEDTVAKRPDNARAMALLADYCRRAGRLDDARRWLERSLAVQPGVRPVLNNLGTVWQALGEPAKAVACFQQALALDPRDASTRNNLGNALVLAGRAEEGIAELEAALRLAPEWTPARVNLANALAASGRLAEAAEQFALLVKAGPADAGVAADYARVLEALGRRAEAVAQLEAAVRLRPADADLRNQLGTALGRAGRVRDALEQFQEALRLNPAHAAARENAARAQRYLESH